jgi:hypothetical protein
MKLTTALAVEKISDSYINLVAIRTADKGKPWVKDLEAAYRSRAFLDATNKYLAGYEKTDYQLALEKTLKNKRRATTKKDGQGRPFFRRAAGAIMLRSGSRRRRRSAGSTLTSLALAPLMKTSLRICTFLMSVQRPVLVELVVDARLQGEAPAVVLQAARAVQQFDVGNIRVVHAGTHVRAELFFRHEVVLQRQGRWQVLEGTDIVAVKLDVMLLR